MTAIYVIRKQEQNAQNLGFSKWYEKAGIGKMDNRHNAMVSDISAIYKCFLMALALSWILQLIFYQSYTNTFLLSFVAQSCACCEAGLDWAGFNVSTNTV